MCLYKEVCESVVRAGLRSLDTAPSFPLNSPTIPDMYFLQYWLDVLMVLDLSFCIKPDGGFSQPLQQTCGRFFTAHKCLYNMLRQQEQVV